MKEGLSSRESQVLGVLQSGEMVYDRPRSHLGSSPVLEEYLPRALAQINPHGAEFLVETVTFDEEIGTSSCVETDESADIVYARRVRRKGLTRFVKNMSEVPTHELTVVLKKAEEGYITITAFVGSKAEPEPWDANATDQSIAFWQTHALVWGTADIIPGTETQEQS